MTDFLPVLRHHLVNTRLFPGKDLLIEVILNPASGLLGSRKRMDELLGELKKIALPGGQTDGGRTVEVNIHQMGSRDESLAALEKGAERLTRFSGKKILLTAGGDGFHEDCITFLMKNNPSCLEKIILFRMPLGTGNDTPLVTDAAKAFLLLQGEGEIVRDSLIRVDTGTGMRDYALNVVSFGLDAFVCLLTEKWKGRIGGDVYKVMVDISTLFYDLYHRTRISRLTLFPEGDKSQNPITLKKRILMNVFGRSGKTEYGGGKKILPGPENHLVSGMFQLPGRIMLKGRFMKGSHWPGGKRVDFFNTGKMILSYPAPLLMEMDGELTHLREKDFPLTVTRLGDQLRVLN